ncbi:hypothetical protein L9F63_013871, partial [Diploptera punctata]
ALGHMEDEKPKAIVYREERRMRDDEKTGEDETRCRHYPTAVEKHQRDPPGDRGMMRCKGLLKKSRGQR